jgi:ABC-2 type transport system ATP-binding protein
VMLSTHIMQEVEAICDRVIIIDKGVIVADEDKNNIYSKLKNPLQIVHVEFDKMPSESDLAQLKNVKRVSCLSGNICIIEAEGEDDIRPVIFSFAVRNNLTVLSLQKQENNLEDVFRHLTTG